MARSLLVASVTLSLIGGGGWALQAVGLARPTRAQLELVKTLHALTGYHRSQATLELDGQRYGALCTQRWYPGTRVSRVVVDRSDVLTAPGNRLLDKSRLLDGEFDLAGCPRRLRDWLSTELIRGASVRFRPVRAGGAGVYEIELHPRTLPIVLFVARSTGLPVRLALTASRLQGTSILHYGTVG